MAGVDGKRGQDREHFLDESLAQAGVMVRHRRVVDDAHIGLGQFRPDPGVHRALLFDQGLDPGLDRRQLLCRASAIGGAADRCCSLLLAEAGNPNLEELVEHRGEDRQELDPL